MRDSNPLTATLGLAVGSRIAGYRLEEPVGRGGMAVVFRAHDERLDRQVALKVLAPGLAEDEAFRRRFIRESRAAAAVDDPNIIPIYDAGEADGVLFIAMRLVRGGDLRTLVARGGPLPPGRAEWIVSAVASALDAGHAAGLVHRDVKPANMLLDIRPGRPDHVYLSDFGVSKASLGSSGLTGSGQFIGTVDYAAPEQIKGRVVDGRTDQYALGCAAFELLSGRPPYSRTEWLAAMYAHLSDPVPALTSLRPELSVAVDHVFSRVLAKSPADRYPSCLEFAAALRTALGVPQHAADSSGHPQLPGAAPDDDFTLDPALAGREAVLLSAGPAVPVLAAAAASAEPDAAPDGNAAVRGPGPESSATVATTVAPGRVPTRRLDSRRVLAAAAAAVTATAAVTAGLVLLTASPSPASTVSFRFSQSDRSGLAVTQLWKLTGTRGSVLDVTITASNAQHRAVSAQLVEPIPAAVAGDIRKVKFFPAGLQPRLQSGQVAIWHLQLAAGGRAVVGYQVREQPAGATQARLHAMVTAFTAVQVNPALTPITGGTPVVVSVTITPLTLQLYAGDGGRLRLSGSLSDGKGATRRELSRAVWSSADPAVAVVNSRGEVTGVSAGQTSVTARAGDSRASAVVLVVGAATAPVVGGSPPPRHHRGSPPPSLSTTPSPCASACPSGSASVSPSPTASASPSASPSQSASAPATSTTLAALMADLTPALAPAAAPPPWLPAAADWRSQLMNLFRRLS